MALTNVWIASFFGPPPAAIGATPVWIAPNDGTVPSAVQSVIASYFAPVAGASPVWIAGFFAPPPAAIGATPICISGWSGAISVIPGSPVNTVAPVASGTLTVGSTLSCTTGTWTNSPTGYAYQWLQNGVNISGATSASYVVVAADAGTSIRCTVTATNAISSASATSNPLSIAALPSAPSNTVAPVVSGSPAVGSTLSCTTGTWTNSPTYTYQWQRGGANISGATSSTYVTVSADGGTSVGCLVTATNASGSASQASNTLAIAAGGTTSVWSASDAAANAMTLSNGGLTVVATSGAWGSVRGTTNHASGKFYVEFKATAATGTAAALMFGLASSGFNGSSYLGNSNYSFGCMPTFATNYISTGFTANYNPGLVYPVTNDVVGMAVDLFAGSVWLSVNNVWTNSSNPATGSLPIISFVQATVGALSPAISLQGASDGTWTLQPTAASQKYLPPPGFQAWDGGPVTPPASSVWSASDAAANAMTLSNGGLTVAGSGTGNWGTVRGSIGQSSGKVYIEFSVTGAISADSRMFGLANAGFSSAVGNYLGSSNNSVGNQPVSGTYYVTTGFTVTPAGAGFAGITLAVNDVLSIAVDFTGQNIWFAHNNVWFTGNPSTATLPFATFVAATVGALFPSMSLISTGPGVWTLQPTAATQKYAPPAGFSPWG